MEHNIIAALPDELLDGGQAHGVRHSLQAAAAVGTLIMRPDLEYTESG
jgi:hypothetical protein